jgi:hypothetical protein
MATKRKAHVLRRERRRHPTKYEPNSFDGPVGDLSLKEPPLRISGGFRSL